MAEQAHVVPAVAAAGVADIVHVRIKKNKI
jgi:hypothetical protein